MEYEYKGYVIHGLQDFALVKIKQPKQGKLPAMLGGHYTNVSVAKEQIDSYLSTLVKPKGKAKDASEESATTG